MRYGFVPVGRDDLEMPCVFIPDGGHAPGALYGGGTAEFRCIFIPYGYDGPPPGYRWVEVGRMTLGAEPSVGQASNGTWPAIDRATDSESIFQRRPRGLVSFDVQPPTIPNGGGPSAVAVTMETWKALSDPQVTLAILDTVSPANLAKAVSASRLAMAGTSEEESPEEKERRRETPQIAPGITGPSPGSPLVPIFPGGAGPKSSPNFLPPTNAPRLPPTSLPPGYSVRVMPPTQDYPNGYWRLYNQYNQAVDPSTGKPPGNVSAPEFNARTHVPLPSK
jgi:hypothetical protein